MISYSSIFFRCARVPIISHHTHGSEDADDGDDDEEFDEGEGSVVHIRSIDVIIKGSPFFALVLIFIIFVPSAAM